MYFFILLILGAIVIWISKESSMLRNELFNEANFCKLATLRKIKDPRPSFSLGRSQLAFWTVIIVSSFIYLFFKCSSFRDFDVPILNGTNLSLLGIAVGTTLVSKTIDNSQKNTQGDAVPQQDYPSKDFFTDIISDEKGVSIHRLQNVIWTVVVGAIYIGFVAGHERLPDETLITTQLLSLMGLSTGAYLGLKLNENKNVPVSEATTNEGPTPPFPPPAPPTPDINLTPSGDGDTGPAMSSATQQQPGGTTNTGEAEGAEPEANDAADAAQDAPIAQNATEPPPEGNDNAPDTQPAPGQPGS